eukprot:gene21758-6053_t
MVGFSEFVEKARPVRRDLDLLSSAIALDVCGVAVPIPGVRMSLRSASWYPVDAQGTPFYRPSSLDAGLFKESAPEPFLEIILDLLECLAYPYLRRQWRWDLA